MRLDQTLRRLKGLILNPRREGNLLHDKGFGIILYEDDIVKVAHVDNQNDENTVLLCFTGIGHALGGIDVQQPEFVGASRVFGSYIYIADKRRSWGNALDFPAIAEIIRPYTDGKSCYALGNSMGGFLAVIAGAFIPLKRVVSFSPQYSIDPNVVPFEDRWMNYREQIASFTYSRPDEYIRPETDYFIMHGDDKRDLSHHGLFPDGENIHKVLISGGGHNPAKLLKSRAVLPTLIRNAFADRPLTDDMPEADKALIDISA